MKFLVLGGGGFLGYHVAREALLAGHDVTTFSRDDEAPVMGAEHLAGDRDGDLSALEGRTWDVVFDTFSDPDAVARTARLAQGAGAYGYVSGISVYHPDGPDTVDEESPLRREGELADDPLQERSVAKLRCEDAVRGAFDGRVCIIRPGIMVGPRDPTDRFTYWPVRYLRALERAAKTGETTCILAPGDPERAVQFTDVRDLGRWVPTLLSGDNEGTYNAVGPDRDSTTAGAVLEDALRAARTVFGERGNGSPEVHTVWADEALLRDALGDVEEEERPLWFPEDQIPFDRVDSSKAFDSGLAFRSPYETALDTLRHIIGEKRRDDLAAGLADATEQDLIRRTLEG